MRGWSASEQVKAEQEHSDDDFEDRVVVRVVLNGIIKRETITKFE